MEDSRRKILHLAYLHTAHWAAPIRRAVHANPALRHLARRWQSTRLSDLAFSIDTRLGYLPLISKDIAECLPAVHRLLRAAATDLAPYLDDQPRGTRLGIAIHGFEGRRASSQLLFRVTSFVAESRACFENLAEYLRVLSSYLGRPIGDKAASYEALVKMSHRRRWATQLQNIRHDLLHRRSLFLAFEPVVTGDHVRYTPLFLLDWRPTRAHVTTNRIPLATLRGILIGLRDAAETLQRHLITQIKGVKSPLDTLRHSQ